MRRQTNSSILFSKNYKAARRRQRQEYLTDVLPKLRLRFESGCPILPVVRETAIPSQTPIAAADDSGSDSSNRSAATETKVQDSLVCHGRHWVSDYHRAAW